MSIRFWMNKNNQDLSQTLRLLEEQITDKQSIYSEIRSLINQDHSQRALESIAKFIKKHAVILEEQGFETFELGVVSNASMRFLDKLFITMAAGHGINLTITFSDLNQASQLVFNPSDEFFSKRYDAILYADFTQGLPLPYDGFNDQEKTQSLIDSLSEQLRHNVKGLSLIANCPIYVQNFASQRETIFGGNEENIFGTQNNIIKTLNQTIHKLAEDANTQLINISSLASYYGHREWFHARNWDLAKLPFDDTSSVLYADYVARSFALQKGKTKRALILDLDNTLWGGVIGDDGLEGIALGQGSGEGEAFQRIQAYAHALSRRGIVLSVCSKNTDKLAREPFIHHPEMILREDDIALFVANWNDKASNIRYIAETLSLGMDSFVFLDDNAVEREQVRRELPLLTVPEIGNDPTNFIKILSAGGYFELQELTQSDRDRNGQYVANSRRKEVRASASNIEEFLSSLEMRAEFQPFEKTNQKRITQLINKTNQFNLTTKRYTLNEVEDITQKSGKKTGYSIRLKDKFGDNGIISVVIIDLEANQDDSIATIDTWLMSCRVLGRQVEEFIIKQLAHELKKYDIKTLEGVYLETQRNEIVSALYPKLGFIAGEKEGYFEADINELCLLESPVQIN